MRSYEELEINNKTEDRSVSEIESEIFAAEKEAEDAIKNIRGNLRELKEFGKINNPENKNFIASFIFNIEEIEKNSEVIFSFKDKLSELYEKIGKNEDGNSKKNCEPEKVENSKKVNNNENEDVNFEKIEEIKEEIEKTIKSIMEAIKKLENGINSIKERGNGEYNTERIIKDLEPLEKSIEELNGYKEIIFKFTKHTIYRI